MDVVACQLGALSDEIARTTDRLGRARDAAAVAREVLVDAGLRLLIAETPIADVDRQRATRIYEDRRSAVIALEVRLRELRDRVEGKPLGRRGRRTA